MPRSMRLPLTFVHLGTRSSSRSCPFTLRVYMHAANGKWVPSGQPTTDGCVLCNSVTPPSYDDGACLAFCFEWSKSS